MQIRVITLRYSEAHQGFSEDALKAATFGRDVLNVTEHFFVHGNIPHLTLVLSLADTNQQGECETFRRRDPHAPDPETQIPEAAIPYYRALKKWRNETAKEEGRPAYAIARNAQFVELIKTMPETIAGLREVEGFGDSFCEKYGKKVLELISGMPRESVQEDKDGATEEMEVSLS